MRRAFRAVHALNRFMRLSEGDRWLIVEAGYYLLCAKVAILATSTRTLLALGHVSTNARTCSHETVRLPGDVAAAVEAIDKSSTRLPFANCLVRAVALRMLLARREIATEVHIGARKDEQGQFAAHAWLTYNGIIVVGGDDARHLYRELVGSSHSLLK